MGCERIFAPSLTLTLQAQRFFLAASARSFLVTALERLKVKGVCVMRVMREYEEFRDCVSSECGVLLLLGQQHLGMCCMCNQCLESQ
jgi:hypothetical protein